MSDNVIHVETKICPACKKNPLYRKDRRYCRPCHAEYMRKWRAARKVKPCPNCGHVVEVQKDCIKVFTS